ncbi:MAG: NAD(+)/NADH kinase [Bacteroidales bacterium]|nr:NAD(+)/NADH kinase [Bacteroidales bacterium]
MLKRVAIFSQDRTRKTIECVSHIVREMCARGTYLYLYEKAGEYSSCSGGLIEKFSSLDELSDLPDLALSVGGDGTYLETMLIVRSLNIPLAGVNTGRLGFLANIPGDDVNPSLDLLYNGSFDIVERSVLEITSPESLFSNGSNIALNEVTIQKADLNMITIQVYVNDVYLNTYWSDGLIISTATGSTAYNLSAGGPILSPEDRSIVISPISPHNLTIRPIVLSGDSKFNLVVEGRGSKYLATCDFRWQKVPFSTSISIKQSAEKLKTVMLHGTDFFTTLRTKLMWGADRRN